MSVHLVCGGDVGDAIATLPILRQLGGGKITLVPTPHPGAKPWGHLAKMLIPLFECQAYVEQVVWSDHEPAADYNVAHFRSQGCYNPYITLAESQAQACGIAPGELDLSPWLECHPSAHSLHQVVMTRSKRYRHPQFPWRAVIAKYSANSLFMGLNDEYMDFIRFGARIEHYKIRNFLDAAEIIQGCRFLVANQSCFGWIAMGLGKRLIQESSPQTHDSRCPRPENIYWHTGKLELP